MKVNVYVWKSEMEVYEGGWC